MFLAKANESNYILHWVLFDGLQDTVPTLMDEFSKMDMPGWPAITASLVYNLSQLVTNESITMWDIAPPITAIPTLFDVIEPVQVINWPLAVSADYSPELCPATMRPYSQTASGVHWTQAYCDTFNPDEKHMPNTAIFTPDGGSRRPVFTGYQHYLDFVNKYGFYPTLADYASYVFNTLKNGQHSYQTLPKLSWLVNIIRKYSQLTGGIPPAKFSALANASRNRADRRQIEQAYLAK